jgi:outer membrane lipoprotein LolB
VNRRAGPPFGDVPRPATAFAPGAAIDRRRHPTGHAWRPAVRVSLGALLASAALLAGCASVARAPADGAAGESLSGRLSVQVEADAGAPARSLSAGFELRGSPSAGRLDLSTPLGSVLAQARWSPTRVVLATPRGETEFTDLDALTREALGESLPVAALFDWLHGRPWPGAPSRPVSGANADFEQLGWVVGLERFGDGLVSARRASAPPATVRIKLDRP